MAKKIKKYKVGMGSETYAISMVDMPAIEENFVALSKEEEAKEKVFLESNEKHMVYGAVLVPDKDIYRNNGEREFYISFSKESIEKMSQDFMKEYRQHEVTLDHAVNANEVCVVESWIKADLYKDKSVALGLNENLPIGTWFCAMKVNNVDTWERIKSGELKGFSVESMIALEEFEKQNNDNMNIETNEMFWDKLKNVLKEAFGKAEKKGGDPIEPIDIEDLSSQVEITNEELEEEKPVEAAPEVVETVEEPKPTDTPTEVEKPADEAGNAVQQEPKKEEVNPHIEELINSLKEEINALKSMNTSLNDKVKEMSKEPSAKPISVNAKPNASDTYDAWREQMRQMIG